MKRIYFSLLIFFAGSLMIFAQSGSGANKGMGSITGKVIDNSTQNPIAYTNIFIKSKKDSLTVTGAITDAQGDFAVNNVPQGKYYAEIKFIGYATQTIDDVTISPKNNKLKLGTIELDISGVMTAEVLVQADRLAVDYQIDKKVVNISQNLMATGGTAVEALQNVPSVSVDVEGNVSLRGSTNFSVFVNGKPSILSGTEALEMLPAASIDKIEIITNPSAKYDPEGMAGIMNVILKDNVKSGFNGLVNAGIGLNQKYNADFLLNYFSGNLNVFAGGNYRDHLYDGTSKSYRETYADTNTYMKTDRDRERIRGGYSGRFGFGYDITKATHASVEVNAGLRGGDRNNYSKITYWETANDLAVGTPSYKYNEDMSERKHAYIGINSSVMHKFNTTGHQLLANVEFSNENSTEPATQLEYTTGADFSLKSLDPTKKIRTNEESNDGREWRVNLDYTNPITSTTKIEAGYQFKFDDQNESYDYEDWNYTSNEWDYIDTLSNIMDFSRTIHAVYGTFSSAIGEKGLQYMLGLRGEYTYRKTGLSSKATPFTIDRFDIFPTAHFSYNINENNQIAASYSRRIDRPNGWYLEPYTSYIDQYTRRVGNPELEPEYSNSYEINYQYAFAKSSYLAIEAYHNHQTNIITRFRTYDPVTKLTYHTFENVNDDYSTGIELMLNWKPLDWFNFNMSGKYYNYQIKTTNHGQTIDQNDNTYSGNMDLTFNITKTTRLQATAMYYGPNITVQGTSSDMWGTSFAVRQDLFNNALSLTLNVRDAFGTMKHDYTTYGLNEYMTDSYKGESPVVMLNMSYRLNNYKPEKQKGSGQMEGGDEEF